MRRTLTAVFDDYEAAAHAVRRLEEAGISYRDISLVTGAEGKHHIVPQGSTEDGSAGAGTGGAAGGAVGAGLGLLAGLGLITIPGLGPVIAAGWLTAALTGAAAGAATGGLVGLLVGAGVRDEDANVYAEGLTRGKTLVVARVGDDLHDKARAILADSPARDLAGQTSATRTEGFAAGSTRATASARAPTHPMIRAGRVAGAAVYDRNNTHIGKVAHVMLDKRSGRVTGVQLASGGLFGAGGEPRAIPWAALSYDPHLQGYRADIPDGLRGAPRA